MTYTDDRSLQANEVQSHSTRSSAATLDERLRAYGSAAADELERPRAGSRTKEWAAFTSAAAAASVMAGTAEATVLYSGPQNIDLGPIPMFVYSTFDNAAIDLNLDAVDDFRVGLFAFYYGSFVGGDVRALTTGGYVARNGTPAAKRFSSGSSIGASADFAADRADLFDFGGGGFNPAFDWSSSGAIGFAGVKLDDHYGWIQIEISAPNTATIIDWAYETEPNVAIRAGDIPEPAAGALTGLGLLALGAEGVRRRRAESRKSD
jgi:hypothetical protein